MKKYENYCKALENLKLVRDQQEPYDVLTTAGSVALFEICFEQAWKAMKEILQEHGYGEGQMGSPKIILKLAYSAGMIENEQGWLDMLSSRNDVVHFYNEKIALEIVQKVRTEYIVLFETLRDEIVRNWL